MNEALGLKAHTLKRWSLSQFCKDDVKESVDKPSVANVSGLQMGYT